MARVMRATFLLACLLAVPFEAITVSPSLCPTNKIAPHKRIASWDRPSYRTFAAFHDLFSPNTPQHQRPQYQGPQHPGPQYQGPQHSGPQYQGPQYPGPQNDQNPLQEQPQEDSDDCGEIEDYDENDLSSLIQQQQNKKRQDRADDRFLFGGFFNRPPQATPPQRPPSQESPQYPPTTTTRPLTQPPRPQKPTYPPLRPPYWSGGLFSNNHYQPPPHEDPSDSFKPVHEANHFPDASQSYRPGVVGGPIGHVVGVTQVRPTTAPTSDNTRRRLYPANYHPQTTQPTTHPTRRPRPRKLNDSVIGSFIDLLFK